MGLGLPASVHAHGQPRPRRGALGHPRPDEQHRPIRRRHHGRRDRVGEPGGAVSSVGKRLRRPSASSGERTALQSCISAPSAPASRRAGAMARSENCEPSRATSRSSGRARSVGRCAVRLMSSPRLPRRCDGFNSSEARAASGSQRPKVLWAAAFGPGFAASRVTGANGPNRASLRRSACGDVTNGPTWLFGADATIESYRKDPSPTEVQR
jgi:hypothetical protein